MDTIESKFVIGCLKSKLQLEKWLDFLESAFREKVTHQAFYLRHSSEINIAISRQSTYSQSIKKKKKKKIIVRWNCES